MKVLFAVNNESISESIIKKYQQEYKEIISAKNVYYFNAIIKELQRDKTYDRIIISEDLQPFSNTNYDQIDKFIFEKMDNISDEATNQNGNDIPIILICTDRREKSEPLLVKLFGIGVYNALIGKDRSITAVCQLLNRPRGKKEAKVYYHIDPDDVDYKVENDGDVSEVEIQNIINHYKRLGKNEEQYVESFDHIASQYTDAQLRLIAKFLPLNVKAVLEANSPKYQEVVAFGMPSKPAEKYNKYNEYAKKNKIPDDSNDLEIIRQSLKRNVITEPVVIPSTIDTNTVKKVQGTKSKVDIPTRIQEEPEEPSSEIENVLDNIMHTEQEAVETEKNEIEESSNIEAVQPKRRGRPKKIKPEETEEVVTVKKGRGRPKKQSVEQPKENKEDVVPKENTEDVAPINLFDLGDEEQTQTNKNEEEIILPGLDNEFLFAQDEQLKEEPEKVENVTKQVEEPKVVEPKFETTENYNETIKSTPVVTNNFSELNTANIITKDRKVVAFIGTSKNGTSFLVNNLAELLSQRGINTAILDLTKNKNSYYIYTENEENLRNVAATCMENLQKGIAGGIQVHKNLTVYTNVPGEMEEAEDSSTIIKTLANNYSLVLIDCDFTTDYSYFVQAQEIYLVQSLDILTIQPLTEFLRNLKAKNMLNTEKIRIVLNKVVKLKSVNEKVIIGGMAYYNDPEMSFMTELFNKDTVKYCTIPFEEQTYSRYLDGIINCKVTLNGYSKGLMSALENLGNMVYPLIGNNTKNTAYSPYNKGNNFSASMNSTLNKMKNNY